MSKKSKEKKQRKTQHRGLPGYAGSFSAAQGDSPAQRALQQRIARSGDHYIQDNFIRVMQNSYKLRNEPEFRELHFDLDKTDAIRSRVMKKYEKQLPAVLKKSKDEQHVFYDEVRIEIIEELATPAWRQDVLKRLAQLTQRLANGKDAGKFEMALVLQPMLQQKEIPWGLCGLITAIYEDSATKADQQFHQAIGEFEKVLQQVEREGNYEKLLALPDESPQIVQAVERLKAKPGLMQELEKDADKAFKEFEEQIANGDVKLDLFTGEELHLALGAMAEYLSTNQIEAETADPQELAKRFAEFIQQSISDVMTKERTKQMKEDLKRISEQWLREKNWRGALLHGEISWLDSVAPDENPFLYAVYVSEMKRWRDARAESNAAPDAETQPESEPTSTDAASNAARGLRERISNLLGKRKES